MLDYALLEKHIWYLEKWASKSRMMRFLSVLKAEDEERNRTSHARVCVIRLILLSACF